MPDVPLIAITPKVFYDVDEPANYHCYRNDFAIYSKARQIESNCGDITFYNKGVSTMVINDIPYPPGTGLSVNSNQGEMDCTRYYLKFTGAGANACFVMRKIFIKK